MIKVAGGAELQQHGDMGGGTVGESKFSPDTASVIAWTQTD